MNGRETTARTIADINNARQLIEGAKAALADAVHLGRDVRRALRDVGMLTAENQATASMDAVAEAASGARRALALLEDAALRLSREMSKEEPQEPPQVSYRQEPAKLDPEASAAVVSLASAIALRRRV